MNEIEFEKKWLKIFAPHLSKQQYDACFVNQFLWHVFSYEVIPKTAVLSGDAAIAAYDSMDKDGAITIQMINNGIETQTAPILEKYKQSKRVMKNQELYIVGKDWTWTFVSTHENGWLGPYFYSIDTSRKE